MTNVTRTLDPAQDPEVVAFVLRIRSEITRPGRRMVVILDDINGKKVWHFNALDHAFTKIRETVTLHERDGDASSDPH